MAGVKGMRTPAEATKACTARKQDYITKYREERGCSKCGETHPACLEFHHTNVDDKHPRLRGQSLNGKKIWGRSFSALRWDDLLAELNKVEVLCANCHRKEEHRLRIGA